MILSDKTIEYFRQMQSKVARGLTQSTRDIPYLVDDDSVIERYECLRNVWENRDSIKSVCNRFGISRTLYYDIEDRFVSCGLGGLFPELNGVKQVAELEKLVMLVKTARPSISQQAIYRITQAVPETQRQTTLEAVSQVLKSYGYGSLNQTGDIGFFGRIQRTLGQVKALKKAGLAGRRKQDRKGTFFVDADSSHKRMELLRELFFNPQIKVRDGCCRYGLSPPAYYRLVNDYRLFGPWAAISAYLPGKETISSELELKIILEKLRFPYRSSQCVVDVLKLKCSRYVVNRVFHRWGLTDKQRSPVALDRFVEEGNQDDTNRFTPLLPAWHTHSEEMLLKSRRINRHFELICTKMNHHAFHICDPGPLLLAPFVNRLGIVQALESYGPVKSRGAEIANPVLTNVFRILGGYHRIDHLDNSRDRSVAFASGLGMFGSSSRFYKRTLGFKFDQLHKLCCDLVSRAKELGVIDGTKIAFDFHLKPFFGSDGEVKGLGKGPDKSGNLVCAFRPHVAWDLAANVIISMTYFHGGVRAPTILQQFCEQNIFSILDPLAIEEIYMDSEYTKEESLHYFKEITCRNGEVFLCLRKNKQIKQLIEPALKEPHGWEKHDDEDECKAVRVTLPKTQLALTIVILRTLQTKENIRCFGSTDAALSGGDILRKYRYRWLIENGIKDLVNSYFLDHIYGLDPEKIEFELYCTTIARLAYEYFLKELGGNYYNKEDGNKTTLYAMRNLLFEKRNATLEQNSDGDLVLTLLDGGANDLEYRVAELLKNWKENGTNKVLWWNNRSILLDFKKQYDSL